MFLFFSLNAGPTHFLPKSWCCCYYVFREVWPSILEPGTERVHDKLGRSNCSSRNVFQLKAVDERRTYLLAPCARLPSRSVAVHVCLSGPCSSRSIHPSPVVNPMRVRCWSTSCTSNTDASPSDDLRSALLCGIRDCRHKLSPFRRVHYTHRYPGLKPATNTASIVHVAGLERPFAIEVCSHVRRRFWGDRPTPCNVSTGFASCQTTLGEPCYGGQPVVAHGGHR